MRVFTFVTWNLCFFMVLWLADLVFIRVFYVLRVPPLLHLVQVEAKLLKQAISHKQFSIMYTQATAATYGCFHISSKALILQFFLTQYQRTCT